MVRPSCHGADGSPHNKRVSKCCAQSRPCTRRNRSHCSRARDTRSHSQSKGRHTNCEIPCYAMGGPLGYAGLTVAADSPPRLLEWFAGSTLGRSFTPRQWRYHVQVACVCKATLAVLHSIGLAPLLQSMAVMCCPRENNKRQKRHTTPEREREKERDIKRRP